MQKSLDRKLAAIHADPSGASDFIIADAKDADMGFGIRAPGLSQERLPNGERRYKTLAEYRQQIREVIAQGIVDIVLMSSSTSEKLTIEERLFDDSPITPAARANDTSDVHLPRGGTVHLEPARFFRSAGIDHMQCGHLDCEPHERNRGVDLGLYSLTFNNRLELDLPMLEQFKLFREEAERKGFRYFLEVFDPNIPDAVDPKLLPGFINDSIVRTLAGVSSAGRPVFLKIVYHGPQAMEELVTYDPHLVVGVLGGSAGTTLDAFQLLYEAKKYGARAALFGRKINHAEHQLAFIEFLRHIADGVIEPAEAVRAYHAVLQKLKIPPNRSLEDDLVLQTNVMSYGGSGTTISLPTPPGNVPSNGTPDFAGMSSEQRLDYHRNRLNLKFGE
ncbi:MAG: hypothetical protein Tsb009_18320 [Planctomycetaceae bacterium]